MCVCRIICARTCISSKTVVSCDGENTESDSPAVVYTTWCGQKGGTYSLHA